MVYSPSNYPKLVPLAGSGPHLVTAEIDAGSIKLQAPKIRPVNSRSTRHRLSARSHFNEEKSEFLIVVPGAEASTGFDTAPRGAGRPETIAKSSGAITQWETPYNQPAFEQPENIQYTRLAAQYLQQGRIEDAERLYRQALIVAERTFKSNDSAVFRAIEDLAGFYYRHEKYREAEPLVARLLKRRVESLESDDWLLIRTVDQLADIYEKCGQPLQAQALYKLLLARQEESIGRQSPAFVFTLSRLADSYTRHGHYLASESLMITILEIQESIHGRYSIEISTTLQELSTIYQKQGRYDKSAEMLERLLHVLESIHGDNGLAVASCLLKLADLLTEVGMMQEADPLYRRAQQIYTLSYGDRTAAHSVFKKKLTRTTVTLSRLSKDKPRDQEECSRFPAMPLDLDEIGAARGSDRVVNRCSGHGVVSDALRCQKHQSVEQLLQEMIANDVLPADIRTEPTPPAILNFKPVAVTGQAQKSAQSEAKRKQSQTTGQFQVPEEFQTLGALPVTGEIRPPAFSSPKRIDMENFAPEPGSALDSILDPLFVDELAGRYEEISTLLEFPTVVSKKIEALDFSPAADSGEQAASVVQCNQQRVTLPLPVPGLITVSRLDARAARPPVNRV